MDLKIYSDFRLLKLLHISSVDDMDELEEALSKKDITQIQFQLAIETSNRL